MIFMMIFCDFSIGLFVEIERNQEISILMF